VVIGMCSIIATYASGVDIESKLSVIRSLRLLRLIKRSNRLQKIFNTIISSLPGIGNTGALLILLIYVYSIIGVQLFSEIQRNDFGLSDLFNFESFELAFLSLVAVGTGDSGPGIMYGTIREYNIDF
jgi:hypothetical protein